MIRTTNQDRLTRTETVWWDDQHIRFTPTDSTDKRALEELEQLGYR